MSALKFQAKLSIAQYIEQREQAAWDGSEPIDHPLPLPKFFAEYLDADGAHKCHGIALCALSGDDWIFGEVSITRDRLIGAYGEREITISRPLSLLRGHKQITLAASEKKPRRLIERIYPLE